MPGIGGFITWCVSRLLILDVVSMIRTRATFPGGTVKFLVATMSSCIPSQIGRFKGICCYVRSFTNDIYREAAKECGQQPSLVFIPAKPGRPDNGAIVLV